jgi:glycosyltransferase involved in cell wall biosynthesis
MKEAWTESAIHYLQHPEEQEKIRKPMMEWARKFYDWQNVALEWNELFKQNIKCECLKQSQKN